MATANGSLTGSSDVSAEPGIAALGIDVAEDERARGYLGDDTTQSLTLQAKAGLGLTF
jgi:hypothetical protein